MDVTKFVRATKGIKSALRKNDEEELGEIDFCDRVSLQDLSSVTSDITDQDLDSTSANGCDVITNESKDVPKHSESGSLKTIGDSHPRKAKITAKQHESSNLNNKTSQAVIVSSKKSKKEGKCEETGRDKNKGSFARDKSFSKRTQKKRNYTNRRQNYNITPIPQLDIEVIERPNILKLAKKKNDIIDTTIPKKETSNTHLNQKKTEKHVFGINGGKCIVMTKTFTEPTKQKCSPKVNLRRSRMIETNDCAISGSTSTTDFTDDVWIHDKYEENESDDYDSLVGEIQPLVEKKTYDVMVGSHKSRITKIINVNPAVSSSLISNTTLITRGTSSLPRHTERPPTKNKQPSIKSHPENVSSHRNIPKYIRHSPTNQVANDGKDIKQFKFSKSKQRFNDKSYKNQEIPTDNGDGTPIENKIAKRRSYDRKFRDFARFKYSKRVTDENPPSNDGNPLNKQSSTACEILNDEKLDSHPKGAFKSSDYRRDNKKDPELVKGSIKDHILRYNNDSVEHVHYNPYNTPSNRQNSEEPDIVAPDNPGQNCSSPDVAPVRHSKGYLSSRKKTGNATDKREMKMYDFMNIVHKIISTKNEGKKESSENYIDEVSVSKLPQPDHVKTFVPGDHQLPSNFKPIKKNSPEPAVSSLTKEDQSVPSDFLDRANENLESNKQTLILEFGNDSATSSDPQKMQITTNAPINSPSKDSHAVHTSIISPSENLHDVHTPVISSNENPHVAHTPMIPQNENPHVIHTPMISSDNGHHIAHPETIVESDHSKFFATRDTFPKPKNTSSPIENSNWRPSSHHQKNLLPSTRKSSLNRKFPLGKTSSNKIPEFYAQNKNDLQSSSVNSYKAYYENNQEQLLDTQELSKQYHIYEYLPHEHIKYQQVFTVPHTSKFPPYSETAISPVSPSRPTPEYWTVPHQTQMQNVSPIYYFSNTNYQVEQPDDYAYSTSMNLLYPHEQHLQCAKIHPNDDSPQNSLDLSPSSAYPQHLYTNMRTSYDSPESPQHYPPYEMSQFYIVPTIHQPLKEKVYPETAYATKPHGTP